MLSAVSCSEERSTEKDADTAAETPEAEETPLNEAPEEENSYKASVPAGTSYDNASVTIYTYPDAGSGTYWCDMDFCAAEETGETLNDALYYRVRNTEEALEVVIKTFAPSESTGGALQKSVMSGDKAYDFAFINAMSCDKLAQAGNIMNLRETALELDAPWWDRNVISGLSVANKVYMLHGDISIMAKKTLRVIYFNKTIAKNYEIPNPYTLVDEMKWTVDSMTSIARAVSEDLDGNGKMDANDRFGFLYKGNIIYPMMIGCGLVIAEKDENDLPYISFYNDNTQTAWEKITAMCWDESSAFDGGEKLVNSFMEDRGLFASIELHNLTLMREMESDFGILPNPMLSEEQGAYYSTINSNVASMLVIPSDCPDVTRASYVLDTMGAESKNILTPAYIESYLKGKVSRDNESEASINIVFDNIRYDLGFCYNWGSLGSFMMNLFQSKSDTLASAFQSTEKIAKKQIERAIEGYLNEE